MGSKKTTKRRWLSVLAYTTAAGLALTGCAGGSNDTAASAEENDQTSVPHGASQENYAEALADMEPVTFTLQSTGPQGAPNSTRFEEYAASVEDWSDGKMTFDIHFSNAIVAPTEVDDALADGRIDFGSYSVTSEPAQFPAMAVVSDMGFLGPQGPVDTMVSWQGTWLEAISQTPEIEQQFEDRGLKVMVPTFQSGIIWLQCTEPVSTLEEIDGKNIAVQNEIQHQEITALGGVPVTIPWNDMYEGLERGVTDCVLSSPTVGPLMGLMPVAPHVSYSPDEGFANAAGAFLMSLDKWNNLPLAAQQLLHDRLDAFYEANNTGAWENVEISLEQIEENNGEVLILDDAVAERLAEEHDTIIEEARSDDRLEDPDTFIDRVLEADDKWNPIGQELATVNGEVVTFDNFLEDWGTTDVDQSPIIETFWDEALIDERPGS